MSSGQAHKWTWLNRLPSLAAIMQAGSVLAPWVNEQRLPYPYRLTLVVTRQCNSRCQMCHIWQQKDLPHLDLDHYRHIFKKNTWWFVRSVTLTGGEPTLRSDLPDIFELVGQSCPNLEHVYLATNALNTARTLQHVERMAAHAASHLPRLSHFQVQVSLDGIGPLHDAIRGIDGFFDIVQHTLTGLGQLQRRFPILSLRLSTVVLPQNLAHIPALRRFAAQKKLPIHFSPIVVSGAYYANTAEGGALVSNGRGLAELFEALASDESSSLYFHYRDIARMARGAPRRRRCMMGFYDFVLEHDGQVYACVNCEMFSFGSALEQPFEELWFGPQARDARQAVRQQCCPSCPSPCHVPPISAWELLQLKLKGRLTRWYRKRPG